MHTLHPVDRLVLNKLARASRIPHANLLRIAVDMLAESHFTLGKVNPESISALQGREFVVAHNVATATREVHLRHVVDCTKRRMRTKPTHN